MRIFSRPRAIWSGLKSSRPSAVSLQESPETLVDNVLGAFPTWEGLGGLIAEKKLFVVNPEKVARTAKW